MSEYIPRLREELVAAAAREQAGERHRPRVRPRARRGGGRGRRGRGGRRARRAGVELPRDETPVAPAPAGTALTYRVRRPPGTTRPPPRGRSAEVLRERIAAAGIGGRDRHRRRRHDRRRRRQRRAARSPRSPCRASSGSSTGSRACSARTGARGPDGAYRRSRGRPGRAVSRYEAVRRAAKARGTRAAGLARRRTRARCSRARGTRDALTGGGSRPRARVWPRPRRRARRERRDGARPLVRARRQLALGNADIAPPAGSATPATGDPIVALDLDALGRRMFSELTRGIAQRGADRPARGGPAPDRAAPRDRARRPAGQRAVHRPPASAGRDRRP